MVLRGLSFTVTTGEWVCVVGASGSGKSTIGNLILRGWDPQSGQIKLFGSDLRQLPLAQVRDCVGTIRQRDTLLTGTIADNLRLRNPQAPESDLHEALAMAGLEQWVASLPDGLDTEVAERGGSVSGGQAQRLMIARALVGKPRILLIDEALSQLDTPTAMAIRAQLQRLGLTVIEITHRVDMIPDDGSQRVIVIDNGQVEEVGYPAELRGADGAFDRLWARL